MYNEFWQDARYLLAIYLAFLLSFFTTPLVVIFAKKFGLVTDSKASSHPAHTHVGVIPRAGGLGIFLGIFIATIYFIPLNRIIIAILLACIILLVTGLLDDKYNLSPKLRLVINLFAASLVVSQGIGIPYFTLPFLGVVNINMPPFVIDVFGHQLFWLGNILAIFWLAAMMNFVNWSKGVDGQLPGFVTITSFFLGLLATRFSAHNISSFQVALLGFIVSGAFAGFLPWNFYPQKIMPGYSGGSIAGFMLGVISLLSFGKFGTFIMCLAIPLTDAFYTIMRRLAKKQSPFLGDRNHLHHKLLAIGWGRRRIAIFYMLISTIFGVATIFLTGSEKVLIFSTSIGLLGLFFYVIDHLKEQL